MNILTTYIMVTIGFTYDVREKNYCLTKDYEERKIRLACTRRLAHGLNTFCFECKSPIPPDWTTGNKSLDSFIIKSWSNIKHEYDTYVQWIEYFLLTDVQQLTLLCRGCTHMAGGLVRSRNK